MKVAFTFAGTVDVPDETSLDNLRDTLIEEVIQRLSKPRAKKDLENLLDKNLVEYDVIKDEKVEPRTGDPIPGICSACGYARGKDGCLCK